MTSANAPATATEPAAVPTVAVESQPAAAQTEEFLQVSSGTSDAAEPSSPTEMPPSLSISPTEMPPDAAEVTAQTQGFLLVTSGTCDTVEPDQTVGPAAATAMTVESQRPMEFSFMGPAAAAATMDDEIRPAADQIMVPAVEPAAAAVNAAGSQPPATTISDLFRGAVLRVEGGPPNSQSVTKQSINTQQPTTNESQPSAAQIMGPAAAAVNADGSQHAADQEFHCQTWR